MAVPTEPDGEQAPRIPEGREDEAFQHALARRALTLGSSVQEGRDYALAICAQLDQDRPLAGLVDDVEVGTGLPPDLVGYVIGVAAACYCPHNLSGLPARPGDPAGAVDDGR